MKELLEKYDLVIGLEIHAELNTKTKLLCGCANEFGGAPNTNCCPVCLAYPDAKPQLNKAAVEKTITAGLAMGADINDLAIWERKCYFYPDLASGYQTSQMLRPVCLNGGITLKSGKIIRLKQIHLEEDAGKLIHNDASGESYVDLNRGGVPLIEIVTKPDISSPDEAVEFLEEVRSRLMFSNVANCKMEEGGMRCDVNLSLVKKGAGGLGARTETKNLNSFKSVAAAIIYEAKRHAQALDKGETILVETRKWNEQTGQTSGMRPKESAIYIVSPDMDVVKITKDDVQNLKNKLPMLAAELKEKFTNEFGLPEYDTMVLTKTRETAAFYLECVKHLHEPKKVSNWLMVDLFKIMNELGVEHFPISAKHFTNIIKMVEDKTITKTVGLQLLQEVINTQKEPAILAKELGLLVTITDEQIKNILKQLEGENPKVIEDYKQNKDKVLKFIVGYVMKNTQGKAKSEVVEKLISQLFD